jgi:hypothetical protein
VSNCAARCWPRQYPLARGVGVAPGLHGGGMVPAG